jgi:monofunctional biosynthetic peptidoglycan transglycosylase
MRSQTSVLGSGIFVLLMVRSSVMAADTERVLFTFDKPAAAKQWQTVNDGVMGGVSDGRFKINDDKNMEFFGTLSLENNGGFASVRSRPTAVNLRKSDSIVARLRGDGREYTMNLYVPRGSGGYSFRQSFKTKKGVWINVSFPLDKFVATYRGRVFPNQKLDPNKVNSMGFLLGDKKAGPFKLEVEWIKVRRGSTVNAATLLRRDIGSVESGHERSKLDVFVSTEGEHSVAVVAGWVVSERCFTSF